MQLLEKILGNMQDSIQRLWICLISRTEEKLPLFVPLILHSCSQTDHCIYTVPIGLRCNCAEDPQLFYLELAVLSTLVINSGSGWEVPGSLKQLLWKSGASSHGAARVLLRTTQGVLVWLSLCLLLCRHSCELQWQDALWRSSLLPDSPTDPCPVRNSHFCHCRNHVSMWENDPPETKRIVQFTGQFIKIMA